MPATGALRAQQPLHGVRQIVRFNLPFYVIGTMAALIGPAAVSVLPVDAHVGAVLYVGIGLAAFWVLASLGASWVVYDRSPLTTGVWIGDVLGFRPRSWIDIHAGLDEWTPVLRSQLGESHGRVFDIHDPVEMTASSIRRARRGVRRSDSESVDFHRLPAASGTVDAALVLFAAHELRAHSARCVLFREIHRVLTPNGRVVVAEHLRDVPNFVAFGPGFLHFHARRAWTRCFTDAGFGVWSERSITPFVRVFVLGRLS